MSADCTQSSLRVYYFVKTLLKINGKGTQSVCLLNWEIQVFQKKKKNQQRIRTVENHEQNYY
jgi:hypothetical protein